MISILCIDDDKEFLNKLVQILDSYEGVRVFAYQDIPSTLPSVDACFLDIEIKNDLSYKLANVFKNIPIIYISNYDHYIFDVIKQDVFDYIRKSHFEDEIYPCIQKLLTYLYNKNQFLNFKYNGIEYRISLMDILYIETYSHHCFIHTIDNHLYEIKKSFSDFQVETSFLIKTHSSYIININHCLSLSKRNAYLKNNTMIPISFRKYKSVVDCFKNQCIKSY